MNITHAVRVNLLTLLVALSLVLVSAPASASTWPDVREGDSGVRTTVIQYSLNARGFSTYVDGQFGPQTAESVRDFQSAYGLTVDGWVGSEAWPVLVVSVDQGDTGDAVRAAQTMLRSLGYGTTVDGWFGPATDDDVRRFQRDNGLTVDGLVGPVTWRHLVGSGGGGGSGGGDYSLPVPDGATSRADYANDHYSPTLAQDLIVPIGTEVYATEDAVIDRIGYNDSCGYGLRVEFDRGGRFTYCHLDSYVGGDRAVEAGELIAYSGDSGEDYEPHLHIEPYTDGGSNRCPQEYLLAIYDGDLPPPEVSDLPTGGCTVLTD